MVDGVAYVEFMPLGMAQELVADDINLFGKDVDNANLAKRLMDYRINDA